MITIVIIPHLKNSYINSILFLLLTFSGVHAQDHEVSWGPEFRYGSNTYLMKIIGREDSVFHVLKRDEKTFNDTEYIVETYSTTTLELLEEMVIGLPTLFGYTGVLQDAYILDGQIYLFVTAMDPITKTNNAYAYKLQDDGTLNLAPTELGSGTFESKKYPGSYSFQLDADSSRVLVYFMPPFAKATNLSIPFAAYDAEMNKDWEQVIDLPMVDLSFEVTKCILTGKNDLFLMSEAMPEKGSGSNITGRSYTVIAYYDEANVIKEYEIALGDQYITSATFTTDKQGDLIIAGFYSNNKKFTISGTFYLKINAATRSIEATGLEDFSVNFLDMLSGKNKEELESYFFDQLIVMPDGSTRMVAEQYYEYTTTFQDFQTGMIRYDYHYVYGPLIVVSVSPQGTIAWESAVLKKQSSTNDSGYYSSYSIGVNGSDLLILYNDNPKNSESGDVRTMDNATKSDAVLIVMDENGNITRNVLFNSKELDTTLRPKFYQALDQALLILGRKGKSYQFGLLTR